MSGPSPRLAAPDGRVTSEPRPPATPSAVPELRAVRVPTIPASPAPRNSGAADRPTMPPAGHCPAKRPPPRHPVRHEPIPTQARASATGGFGHWPTSRARGGEARWRRSDHLLPNRLAAARVRSWCRVRRGVRCPAAGPFGLGTFWIDDATRGRGERLSSLRSERACGCAVLARGPTTSVSHCACARCCAARSDS